MYRGFGIVAASVRSIAAAGGRAPPSEEAPATDGWAVAAVVELKRGPEADGSVGIIWISVALLAAFSSSSVLLLEDSGRPPLLSPAATTNARPSER